MLKLIFGWHDRYMQQNEVLSKELLCCQVGNAFIDAMKRLKVVLSQYVVTDTF